MSIESNINMYYEELVSSIAERAIENIKYRDADCDESEAINDAINDGLIYYADQAYIVAHALQNGFIKWGGEIEWDAIYEDLYADIADEIEYQRKEEE